MVSSACRQLKIAAMLVVMQWIFIPAHDFQIVVGKLLLVAAELPQARQQAVLIF